MKAACLAFFSILSPLFSQTITVSAIDGFTGQFRDSNDQLLPFGSSVRIGSFDLSGANLSVIQNSCDFQEIDNLFTPLAEGQVGGGSILQAGNAGNSLIVNDSFTSGSGDTLGQITGISSSYIAPGTDLFMWIFNSSSESSATEWAIVSSGSSAYDFPTSPGATTLTAKLVNFFLRGSKDGDNVLLSPIKVVPEPSSMALTLLGVLFLLGQRKRRVFAVS